MPRVSVIMPMYNHGHCCARAVRSILEQTLDDLELVVVDDGSTDNSAGVAESAGRGDCRLVVLSAEHRGIVGALNHGLAHTSGALIARMDADDVSRPGRLAAQVEMLEADDTLAAVDCRVELAESPATGEGMRRHIQWVNSLSDWQAIRRALFVESPLVHPAVLMRREAFAQAGGYLNRPGPEDYSLWLRMVEAGWKLGKVRGRLFTWSDPPERLTRTHSDYSAQAMFALKAAMLPRIYPRCREGAQVWGAGQAGRRLHTALDREGISVIRYFDIDPRKVGRRLRGVPVLGLDALVQHRGHLTLVAIGVREARKLVRRWAVANDWTEGVDFVICA